MSDVVPVFLRRWQIELPAENAAIEGLGVRLTDFRFGGLSLLVISASNGRQI